jgi:hypothetical protein
MKELILNLAIYVSPYVILVLGWWGLVFLGVWAVMGGSGGATDFYHIAKITNKLAPKLALWVTLTGVFIYLWNTV